MLLNATFKNARCSGPGEGKSGVNGLLAMPGSGHILRQPEA